MNFKFRGWCANSRGSPVQFVLEIWRRLCIHYNDTVVKRTRVPAGSLVKMATDAASLRPGLCELWRPYNLQRDHTSCADTKKYKWRMCHKQCTVGNLYFEKIGRLNLGSDEGAFSRRRGYLQWKQTAGTRVPVANACGYVVRSRYQNTSEYSE